MNEMMGYDVHEERFSRFQLSFSYIARFLKSYGLELFCVSLRKGDGDEGKGKERG